LRFAYLIDLEVYLLKIQVKWAPCLIKHCASTHPSTFKKWTEQLACCEPLRGELEAKTISICKQFKLKIFNFKDDSTYLKVEKCASELLFTGVGTLWQVNKAFQLCCFIHKIK
jgi:hypothetical protein